MTRTEAEYYIRQRYGVLPEYPWMTSPEHAVFRHGENQKWFGIILRVSGDKLGLERTDTMDVINVKCDPVLIGSLLGQAGIFPAYHMNKAHWLSVALDGSAADDMVRWLIDMSYTVTAPKPKKTRSVSEGRAERIARMEQIYDSLWEAVRREEGFPETAGTLCAALKELTAYYDSGLWLSDYEADERGELPSGLKRGVLSQDGVFDLLEKIRAAKEKECEKCSEP